MKTLTFLAFVAAMATTTTAMNAQAARLVILAVNSGNDFTAPYLNLPPNLPSVPPGAKGFLIGIDLQDNLQDIPLGVQDILFTNVVHKQGINDENGNPLPTPVAMMTRDQAQLQQVFDSAAPVNLPPNGYLRSDSYVMTNPQQGSFVWTPVGTGFEGGAAGDTFLRITGSLGIPSQIDGPGPVQLAYIVATGDVTISGIIARGAVGFNVLGDSPNDPRPVMLCFDMESIALCAEPSTLLLAGIGLMGLAFGVRIRRRKIAGD